MDIHTGRTSNKCTECGKCLSQSSTLLRHVRAFHSGENSNKCTEWANTLLTLLHWADTSAAFTLPKNHIKCTECGQCFPRRDKLRDHVRRMHTDG
ncbi:hypothetical protein CEXT_798441 [Caerostris extrusa]|uniref:C2H2-type domain-containing protein n=1 Tax=Caerostris extrusa TaxID=172846 RepID=A0AAV4WSX7_CAEEX|nr:hypothetical protein CEXT_798441 [Caerostris extrusa]